MAMNAIRRRRPAPSLAFLSILLTVLAVSPPARALTPAPSFRGLGQLLGGVQTYAMGVSGDGSVVVGYAWMSSGGEHAFRWTAADGMQDLGTLPGGSGAVAYAASSDGSAVVGRADDPNSYYNAFRWTPAGGMQKLPFGEAQDVSADGKSAVGFAILWTEVGGVQYLPGVTYSFGISSDGHWVVGQGSSGHAFRWSGATGTQDLGSLSGPRSDARAVSANGAVVVGEAQVLQNPYTFWHAFRWTPARGMEDLRTLGGPQSAAYGVSDDGSVIVGKSLTTSSSASETAFRWTTKRQMQNLKRELLDLGVQAVANWTLVSATDVSADGTVIVGYGLNPNKVWEAFRAVLPIPQ